MLSLHLLGQPRILTPTPVAALTRTQTVAMLAVLALHRKPVQREHLRFLFWPDEPEPSAQHNLRSALHRLRAALQTAGCPDALLARRDHLALNETHVSCDVWQFVTAANDSLTGSATAAQRAIKLYSGPFLDGLSPGLAGEFDAWRLREQTRLEQTHLRVLDALTEAHEASGQTEQAIALAERVTQADPLNELGHTRLMRLLARAGKRDAALRQFALCAQTLRQELDIDPLPETLALKEEIAANRLIKPAVARVAASMPAASHLPLPLPAPATALLGRASDVQRVRQLLASHGARLITLLGPGGVGKTRLAIEVARLEQEQAQYAHGVCYVPLASANSANDVHLALAGALKVRLHQQQPALDQLAAHCAGREMLLILDNFEQLLGSAVVVSRLLDAAPRLKVLVTSRALLRIYGERAHVVAPLALPGAGSDDTHALEAPAVALFVERARAVQPGFEADASRAGLLARICHRLDGLPLAIELAAARLRTRSLKELDTHLAARLIELDSDARDGVDRQQTLRATIAWSHTLLGAHAREAFATFGAFDGACTREALMAACPQLPEQAFEPALAELADHSLLRVDATGDAALFDMLVTVREFAREQLLQHAASDEIKLGMAWHHARRAETLHTHTKGALGGAAFEEILHGYANYRKALAFALSRPLPEVAGRMCAALARFWSLRGMQRDGLALAQQALALPAPAAGWRARCALGAAGLAVGLGAVDDVMAHANEALEMAMALTDTLVLAEAENMLGVAARRKGDASAAHGHYTRALETFRQRNDTLQTAMVLNNLGGIAQDERDYPGAEARFREALGHFRALKDLRGISALLTNLGVAVGHSGRPQEALALHAEALALRREMRDGPGQASTLRNMGDVHLLTLKHPEQAEPLFRESIALFNEVGDQIHTALLLDRLAATALEAGAARQATRRLSLSAELLGAVKGARFSSDDQTLHDSVCAACRAALGEAEFSAQWQLGRASTLQAVLE